MATEPDATHALRETLLFDWREWNTAVAWRSSPALAIALGAGIAAGHPAAGLVAAGGAFTTGLGSLQRIRGSCILPMLLAAVGITFSTFVGSILGHQSVLLVLMAGLWSAAYALLTAMKGGTSWVGLQWTIFLLVASAFHTHPYQAMQRAAMVFAGGILQTLITALVVHRWRRRGPAPIQPPEPDTELHLNLDNLRRCTTLRVPVCLYGLRMALVVIASAEIDRHLNYLSGYWIPMTTLVVVRPDIYQTLTRGLMRVAGTVAGGWLAGLLAAYLHPSPTVLAVLVVFFAWGAFSLLKVNYSLYTLCLTAYIVFLLSLSGLPPATVVHRRAAYTLLGGAIALLAYADVFLKTGRWLRQTGARFTLRRAA
ncbi:MAG: FUSC family protein [Acidobacteriaceae bacterium]